MFFQTREAIFSLQVQTLGVDMFFYSAYVVYIDSYKFPRFTTISEYDTISYITNVYSWLHILEILS